MTRTHVLALTAAASLTGMAGLDLVAVDAKPVSYELPAESAALKPGPNLELVQGNYRVPFDRLYPDPAARAAIQERLLASGSDEDDQGLRRAHR